MCVNELREIWAAAGLSMNEFARLHPVDKGTISRYLNGKRVPRDRWFLDELMAIQSVVGAPVTTQVRKHLTGLQLRALEVAGLDPTTERPVALVSYRGFVTADGRSDGASHPLLARR